MCSFKTLFLPWDGLTTKTIEKYKKALKAHGKAGKSLLTVTENSWAKAWERKYSRSVNEDDLAQRAAFIAVVSAKEKMHTEFHAGGNGVFYKKLEKLLTPMMQFFDNIRPSLKNPDPKLDYKYLAGLFEFETASPITIVHVSDSKEDDSPDEPESGAKAEPDRLTCTGAALLLSPNSYWPKPTGPERLRFDPSVHKTTTGKTIVLAVDWVDTVESVKVKIKENEGIALGKQILMFDDKELENNLSFKDYGIGESDFVLLDLEESSIEELSMEVQSESEHVD